MESINHSKSDYRPIARYGKAVAVAVAGALLRLALSGVLNDRVTYITFYPAVMTAAVLGGFGPGVLATLITAAIADYWLLYPPGSLAVSGAGDIIGLSLFVCMGVFMSVVAGLYRQSRNKAIDLEKELARTESNRRLGLLSDTASQLLQTNDPRGLVQSLCERVMKELDCHVFFNFLVGEEHGRLQLNAFAGIPEEAGRSIEWLEHGQAVCDCAARDGCRIVAEDIPDTFDPRTEVVKGYGILAYACHPLLGEEGRVIGTLSFGSKTVSHFSEDDLALMKAVADQVATAMDRMRLLTDARKHAQDFAQAEERLRLAQDAAHAAAWEWDLRTNENIWSEDLWKLYGLEPHSCEPSYEAWRQTVHPDDLAATERAVREASRRGTELNIEYRVRLSDGGERWLMSRGRPTFGDNGRPERLIGIVIDITDRKHHERHEREIEAQKREFYKRTILAATEGKLMVCDKDEIDRVAGPAIASWHIDSADAMSEATSKAVGLAREAGMKEQRDYDFLACITEAAANVVKHARTGIMSLHKDEDVIIAVISDSGPGIAAMALPDVALTRNYSTAGTLGMGYKLMIHFADRVYLASAPEGTTVAIEMTLKKPDISPEAEFPKTITGWHH
jgi:PAS domain S-box-containing protein